jgi:hypothetical protein
MNSVIGFFEPFFNAFLFNHRNLALIEISFFCTVFLFGIIGKLVDQKPNFSGVLVGYGYSIIVFLNSAYITFVELTWWKAVVNIVVSLVLFVIVSEIILSLMIMLFGGFFYYEEVEPRIKRRTVLLILIILLSNIMVSLHINKLIF